jgi:hypothetical protein
MFEMTAAMAVTSMTSSMISVTTAAAAVVALRPQR